MNGTRLGLYEHGKSLVSSITGLANTNMLVGMISGDEKGIFSYKIGSFSGIVGSMLANPFYIAKTRIQSYSPQLPVGHQHNYQGSWRALWSIYQNDGIRGLFRYFEVSTVLNI